MHLSLTKSDFATVGTTSFISYTEQCRRASLPSSGISYSYALTDDYITSQGCMQFL